MNNKQLYEKENNINKPFFPVVRLEDIIDTISEKSIQWILNNYNHIYVEWKNDVVGTRLSVPTVLRRNGLWITYNNGDRLITEYYIGKNTEIKDKHWQDDTNWEDYTNKLINGTVEYRHLSESLKQLFNKGNVTNFPDEEDLTSDGVALSFKDRKYQPENFSGLGRVILRKNIVKIGEEYKNIITQSMINKENTIYEIRYDFNLNGAEITIPKGCALDFKGGNIGNGKIGFNNCLVHGNIKFVNIKVLSKLSNDTIHVDWFGTKGDGINDDSEAIKSAIAATKKDGATLVFGAGKTYMHGDGLPGENGTGNSYIPRTDNPKYPLINNTNTANIGRDIRFIFGKFNNFTIEGNGAKIISHPNNGECKHNAIFVFWNTTNITIRNLTVDGQKHLRNPKFNDVNYQGEIWNSDGMPIENDTYYNAGVNMRSNIQFLDFHGIILENVISVNSMMDNIDISSGRTESGRWSSEARIINCNTSCGYRQNITVGLSHNVLIEGGSHNLSGKNPNGTTCGTLPKAAIDIEAESNETTFYSSNITIQNCSFNDNTVGIALQHHSKLVKITHNKFENCGIICAIGVGGEDNEVSYNSFVNGTCALGQKNSNIHHNHFLFNKHFGSDIPFDDLYVPKTEGKSSFHHNTIIADLTKLSFDGEYNYGSFRLEKNLVDFYSNHIENIVCNLYDNLTFKVHSSIFYDNTFVADTTKYPQLSLIEIDNRGGGIGTTNYNNSVTGYKNKILFANRYYDGGGFKRVYKASDIYGKYVKVKGLNGCDSLHIESFGRCDKVYITAFRAVESDDTYQLPVCEVKKESTTFGGIKGVAYRVNKDIWFKSTSYDEEVYFCFEIRGSESYLRNSSVISIETSSLPTSAKEMYVIKSNLSEYPILPDKYMGVMSFTQDTDAPIWFSNGRKWVDGKGNPFGTKYIGISNERPYECNVGTVFFDTNLNKLIVCIAKGKWVDANGADV